MAKVSVKTFGVIRMDLGVKEAECESSVIADVIEYVNSIRTASADPVVFGDIVVFINGVRITDEDEKLNDGDEVWFMTPPTGG